MTFDHAFWEKLILLLLTALLTGFGLPSLLKRVEEKKNRQAKIIEAQSKLLDDLTQLLWKWRYLAKGVVYYGAEDDSEFYGLAKTKYEESVWEILCEFRVQITKSRRLVSERAYARLDSLYDYVVHDVDVEVRDMLREELDIEQAKKISNRFSDEVSKRLDDAIDELALELNLKVKA